MPEIEVGRAGTRRWQVLGAVVVRSGVAAGLGGMLLALLLRGVQHIAYGYGANSDESFLQGVTASAPLRRVAVLSICGLVAGLGWWALRRFGRPLVSISAAVKHGKRMPPGTTAVHDLL